MLTVTEEAKRELASIAAQRGLSPAQCLRLTIPPKWTGEGDFGVVIDVADPTDVVIRHDTGAVLRLEPDVAERLARSMLDYKETPQGMGFALDVF